MNEKAGLSGIDTVGQPIQLYQSMWTHQRNMSMSRVTEVKGQPCGMEIKIGSRKHLGWVK